MRKVFIVAPEFLPIPAVRGGAVETLISELINENEKYRKCYFFVTSVKEGIKKKNRGNYNFSRIIYLKNKGFIDFLFAAIVYRLLKWFKINCYFSRLYYLKAYIYACFLKPDLIIAEGLDYYDMQLFSKKFGRDRCVLHLHHEKKCDQNYRRVFGRVITPSSFIKNSFLSSGNIFDDDAVSVIRNGISKRRFTFVADVLKMNELKKELCLANDDFVVIYCGRVVPVKGVLELVKSWEFIAEKDIKLIVVGGSNFADSIKTDYVDSVIKTAENDERIVFTGYVANELLCNLYLISQLAVVPSVGNEAAGLVAIEAMMCGKPVIASESGGLPEYVDETCATVIPKENMSKNIAEAIHRYYYDSELLKVHSKNAIERAKFFDSHQYYCDMSDYIMECINV